MGQRIDCCKSHAEHTLFSQQVDQFCAGVKKIVEDQQGSLVYAGGDDVLALLPVSTALKAAHQLAEQFQKMIGNYASAGIAITHYLSPLSIALEEAHNAEHAAKSLPGKDAIAIHALKRSGEILHACTKWQRVGTFQRVIDAIDDERLSSKIAYDLRESTRAFPVVNDGFKAEIRRLLGRHEQKPSKPGDKELDEQLGGQLMAWADEIKDPLQFTDWLVLARFMAQGDTE
jgi:CRISPR-associated protein Cmr2